MTDTTTTVDPQAAVPVQTDAPAVVTEGGDADRIAELEAENAQLATERDNYKIGMLKAKGKAPTETLAPEDETDEERQRRITREEIANSQIARNNAEREELLKKVLKENKELKLAQANKTPVASATGSHSESAGVSDTLLTPEQEKYFRGTLKWSDKEIESYKKNLQKKR